MSRRSSRKQRGAAWTAVNLNRGKRTCLTQSIHSLGSSSPIKLSLPPGRVCIHLHEDTRRVDAEHYIRLAQSCLDMAVDRVVLSRTAFNRDDPVGREILLVDRVMSDARRLGKHLSELLAWLDQVEYRPTILTDRDRGVETLDVTGPTGKISARALGAKDREAPDLTHRPSSRR